MKRSRWVHMPHAGHYICAFNCHFHLNTYVGGYIVSTIGELSTDTKPNNQWEKIGADRLYETMVFKAYRAKNGLCCPYRVKDWTEIDFIGYKTSEEAFKGHYKLCKKWSKI